MTTVILVLAALALALLALRKPLNHAIARLMARHYGRDSVPRHLIVGDPDEVLGAPNTEQTGGTE